MLDTFGRPLKSLRVSLIDKCNLRCQYCMPEEEYVWLPRDDILTVEQIGDLVDVFSELGVDKVRLTGGEPLLHREAADVVERLAANPDVRDLSMTTNWCVTGEAGGVTPKRRAGPCHREPGSRLGQ